ncbi:hypothetical protein ACVWW5_001191 [Bradyrhizobium sp. LM3.4]
MAKAATAAGIATGQCLCGKVTFEIDVPARWAWHDHSAASRRAHGAAYATYVGSWKKRFRIISGKTALSRYEDKATKTARSFCTHCGTPVTYERPRGPHMVNIPRALFKERTGRQPLYHIAIEELQEWAYTGEPLVPLTGFSGRGLAALEKEKASQRRRSVRSGARGDVAHSTLVPRTQCGAKCRAAEPGPMPQRTRRKSGSRLCVATLYVAPRPGHETVPRNAAMIALPCARPAISAIMRLSSRQRPRAWRKHEEQDHRPLRLSRVAQGRGHHASVR